VPETVLKALIAKGYFRTKAEAVRAGILALGEKYGFDTNNPKELELNLVALKIKQQEEENKRLGRRPYTEAEVKKKYGLK
jgi:Arc/MetJ-type ribon-helix-helix transcriptional regulator